MAKAKKDKTQVVMLGVLQQSRLDAMTGPDLTGWEPSDVFPTLELFKTFATGFPKYRADVLSFQPSELFSNLAEFVDAVTSFRPSKRFPTVYDYRRFCIQRDAHFAERERQKQLWIAGKKAADERAEAAKRAKLSIAEQREKARQDNLKMVREAREKFRAARAEALKKAEQRPTAVAQRALHDKGAHLSESAISNINKEMGEIFGA